MVGPAGRGRRRTAGTAAVLVTLVLTTGRPAVAEGAQGAREDGRQDSLGSLIPALLDLVEAAPTARAWRDDRPGASLQRLGDGERLRSTGRTATAARQGWCGRGTREVALADGGTARKTVYFYPPPPGDPADLSRPTGDEDTWARECRLRAAELRLDADAATGRRLGADATDALRRRLGDPSGDLELDVPRGRWLEPGGLWRWRGGKVVAGYNRVSNAVVASAAHASYAAGAARSRKRSQRNRRRVTELGDSARSRGLDTLPLAAAERVLRAVYREGDGSEPVGDDSGLDSAFVSILAAWTTAADGLPPGNRAEAYRLGDRLVTWTYPTVSRRATSSRPGTVDSSLIRRLTPLGLQFGYSPLGASHVYVHSWLRKAREVAPQGTRAADDAFVALLRRGLDTSGTCREGPAQFAAVLREGVRFLRERGSSADPEVRAEVHRMVGDAYADIVTVAAGVTESSNYVGEDDRPVSPERARRKALEHYRATLELTDDREVARAIWEDAWRLAAGLPLERTRFVCIYD